MLAAHSDLIDEEGPFDPYAPTFSVPHQHDIGRMVSFNPFTAAIDGIITQCGYPEGGRARLTEINRRIAAYRIAYYKRPAGAPFPATQRGSSGG